jgi:hypothetical protein
MARRSTIGENPLDSVIPVDKSSNGHKPDNGAKVDNGAKGVKDRMTVHLSVELIERVKNAVYWTPGMTVAQLAEEALAQAVEGLERAHGGPFPARTSELSRGRPVR